MGAMMDKAVIIREEFECFVRIGLDVQLRKRVQRVIEHHLLAEERMVFAPMIYVETRGNSGELREIWELDADANQLLRLLEFLRRFSVNDVRMIDRMLHSDS